MSNTKSGNIQKLIDQFLIEHKDLRSCRADLEKAYTLLEKCYTSQHKVMICGNGGSAADAEHMVAELMKGFVKPRTLSSKMTRQFISSDPQKGAYLAKHLQGALPAIALTGHPSLSTAFANDVAPDMVFAQQLYGYASPGDILIGLSTSGNSPNVLNALRVAKILGIRTLGFSGESGGEMAEVCDVCLKAPSSETYKIQEYHLPLYHLLCLLLEETFF